VNSAYKVLFTICFASLFFLLPLPSIAMTIPPNDPGILYVGRVDLSDPTGARFDWSGVTVAFRFQGQTCNVLLEDGNNDYNVLVDGEKYEVWGTEKEKTAYEIKGLKDGEHEVRVIKRTEGVFGPATFKGIDLPDGAKLLDAPKPRTRRMEVLGDSYTAGYGNEGPGLKCDSLRPYQNFSLTYAAILADEFGADLHAEPVSGRGMVRNYGDKETTSKDPCPLSFGRTLLSRDQDDWDFSKYQPDLFIVFLGLNDFSTEPHAEEQVWSDAYKALLDRIWKASPDTKILCLGIKESSLIGQYLNADVLPAYEKSQPGKLFYFELDSVPQEQRGCDWHPKVEAHKHFAESLDPEVEKIMGWTLGSSQSSPVTKTSTEEK